MTDDGKSTFETVPVLVTVFPADSLPGDTPIGLLLLLGSFLLIGLMKGRTRPAPPRNREDDPSGGPWKRPLKC
jgi:hypothetical protein